MFIIPVRRFAQQIFPYLIANLPEGDYIIGPPQLQQDFVYPDKLDGYHCYFQGDFQCRVRIIEKFGKADRSIIDIEVFRNTAHNPRLYYAQAAAS